MASLQHLKPTPVPQECAFPRHIHYAPRKVYSLKLEANTPSPALDSGVLLVLFLTFYNFERLCSPRLAIIVGGELEHLSTDLLVLE